MIFASHQLQIVKGRGFNSHSVHMFLVLVCSLCLLLNPSPRVVVELHFCLWLIETRWCVVFAKNHQGVPILQGFATWLAESRPAEDGRWGIVPTTFHSLQLMRSELLLVRTLLERGSRSDPRLHECLPAHSVSTSTR